MKKPIKLALTCAVLAGLGWGGWIAKTRYQRSEKAILPMVQARQGEFVVIIPCRGELKADRSAQVYAPLTPNLRISWMAAAGDRVAQGDALIRFDSSSSQQDLIQKEAALRQAQATLDQAAAQAHIAAEHDVADGVDAKYQLELAQIKSATNEFIARLEAKRNEIDLSVAEQKQRLQAATAEQHKVSDEAKLASLTRQRDLAQADLDLMKSRYSNMEVTAPLTGFFIVSSNYNTSSSLTSSGQPFKVGDTVTPGTQLAVIPDMASLMVDGRVEEIDRGRITVGNDVRVRVDALPELAIPAKLTQISPLAELSLEGTISRNFRGYAALTNPDSRLRPGMNAGMDIIIQRIPNAVSVPSKAVFTRAGKPIVYVVDANSYRPVEIEILARNPDEVAISGIAGNAIITLVEPGATAPSSNTSKTSSDKGATN